VADSKKKSSRIKIRPFRQSAGMCGAASLKMVLDYYGVLVPEREIAKIANATKEKGTSPAGLVKAAEHFGFKAMVKENCSLDDLRRYVDKKIPVIVNWFENHDGGHYSVVVDINKKNIVLADPLMRRPLLYSNTRKMPCKRFMEIWFDYIGDYPKTKEDMVLRLIVVVTLKEEALF